MTRGNPLNVIMLAAEASPYAKVGGLGDVIGALPKALESLGANLAVVIPAYRAVRMSQYGIQPCELVPQFVVSMGSSAELAEVFQTRMHDTDVDVYLIGSKKYFDREGIYDDPATKEGYPDNMQRFIFFMKSALELLQRLKHPWDVIHCHDSHTALIPGLIKTNHGDNPFFKSLGTLFTIHNLAYQGLYPKESLAYAGIDPAHFHPMSPFEFWGRVNFMKAGIEFADKVNTVSPTYSVEIQSSPEFGMGLEGILQRRKRDISGIVNGIDLDEWNPENDPLITAHFSKHDLSGKVQCKEHLLQYFGLARSRERIPLIGMVSRLADQKGFDLVAEAIEEIAALNMQLVILGMGQQKYHDLFQRIALRYPGKIGVQLSFDNGLAHRIEAGCDMLLMPSRFEPCGLNQLYSFRYGTAPIARKTGGLADTVIPYDHEKGTGFVFLEYKAADMMAAIKQALRVYSEPSRWEPLMIRGMSQDWSWKKSAARYLELYQRIYLGKHPND